MMLRTAIVLTSVCVLTFSGCSGSNPTSPSRVEALQESRSASPEINGGTGPSSRQAAEPPFHLQAVLNDVRGGNGFGLVKFRQPADGETVVYLEAWVRDLAPNTNYSLERAVDQTLDEVCTSSAWLTLGKGLAAEPIVTDDRGFGRAELFRALPPTLLKQAFDIHFRVVPEGTTTTVLQSGCYRFIVNQ